MSDQGFGNIPVTGDEHVLLQNDEGAWIGEATTQQIANLAGVGPDSVPAIPAWRTVFDLNDETDLSAFTETGDGTFTFVGGVIAQTNAAATDPLIVLPFATLLLSAFPVTLAMCWQAEVRITRALAAAEFVVVDGHNRGIEFNDDGTVDDDGVSGSETAVLDEWYSVSGGTFLLTEGFGSVEGVTTPGTLPEVWSHSHASSDVTVVALGQEVHDKWRIQIDGGVAVEIRNLKVYVLALALPT